MPQFNKSAPKRAANSAAPVRKPGSKSEGHRGYRPSETDAPKKRWTTTDRAQRAAGAASATRKPYRAAEGDARDASADRRPNWTPRERPAREARTERPAYGDRAPRTERPAYTDRPARAERPAYNDRPARAERPAYGDRPARAERPAYGDRPARAERPAYNDRPARASVLLRPSGSRERPRTTTATSYRTTFSRRASGPPRLRPRRASRSARQQLLSHARAQRLHPTGRRRARASRGRGDPGTDVEGITFADLGLGSNIVRELAELGAESPFPIQAATIPDVLAGRDVLGRGKTGSGKTIAFGAPLVERLMPCETTARSSARIRGTSASSVASRARSSSRRLASSPCRSTAPFSRSLAASDCSRPRSTVEFRSTARSERCSAASTSSSVRRVASKTSSSRVDSTSARSPSRCSTRPTTCATSGSLSQCSASSTRPKDGGQRLLFSATLDKGVATLVEGTSTTRQCTRSPARTRRRRRSTTACC